ncbi:MAG TPA: TetR/AcrR family transcriptional regulator, partial [Acidobacteriota bacterium]|nr:TetR/AcrR family transcriptional regulator [Acidobacteriota bacterium]
LREKEARRSQILDAARDLFFSKGFESTTIDDIARKTELSKGAIYLYFPSKEEIYFTLMEEGVGILYSMLEKASKGNVPADTLLRRIGHAYFDFYREYPGYFRSLFLYYSSSEMQSKITTELCAKCEEQAARCLMLVAKAIEKGVESGLFKPCNAFEFAVMTWTSQNGIILLGERGEYQQLNLGTTMERIQDLFLESVIVALKHGR